VANLRQAAFALAVAMLLTLASAPPSYALRANMLKDLQRLEELGHYERVLFYRKSTMDMVLALHVAWAGAPYDSRMDGVYAQLDNIYGTGKRTRHRMVETRVDRRYWGIINSQKRAVTDLLAKAKLSPSQLGKLDLRVRVYIEDHMRPDFDEMGNFFFRRKAMVFERTGLFWDASFRRRLTGYYCMRVCVPYYATIADELAARGDNAQSAAYRRKSEWFHEQGLREFRRSNGNRLLSELQKPNRRQRLSREQVVKLLKSGLRSKEADARVAAVQNLTDLGETQLLLPLASDTDVEIRREVARAFANNVYLAGLQAMSGDPDEDVRKILASVPRPLAEGLKPGIRVQYLNRPGADPVTEKVIRTVNSGFRGNDRFQALLRQHWVTEEVFPANAGGQFMLKLTGKIYVPREGQYRFYVKTESGNRATIRLSGDSGRLSTIISPKNDAELMYADQCSWGGSTVHRVDFSRPLGLSKGMKDIEIEYRGGQANTKFGKVGLRLYWSSDQYVMEIVPAWAFYHEAE